MAISAPKGINPLATAIGLAITALVLVSAILLTQHSELPWVAFLSGLVFAATLAVVYRLTHTNPLLDTLRRDLRRFESDFPVMVAYAGADEVIRTHNRGFRDWLKMRADLVDGHSLGEVMGATAYQAFRPAIEKALKGRLALERIAHEGGDGTTHLFVQGIPRRNNKGRVEGIFLTLLDLSRFGTPGDATGRFAPPNSRAPRAAGGTPGFAEKTMMVAPAARVRPDRGPTPPKPVIVPTAAKRPSPAPAAVAAKPLPAAKPAVVPKVTAAKPDLELAPATPVMDLEVQSAPVVPDLLTPAPARAPTPMRTAGGERQAFVKTMTEELTKWNNAGDRLRAAIENDEFCLYAQEIKPVVAGKGTTPLFELLLRLQEEEDGLMPPGAFIPIAEEYGMLPDLDRWVVSHILGWVVRHPARQSVIYSVNVSAPTFAALGFPEFVASELRKRKLPGSLLCFEIAEADAMANVSAASDFVEKLAALGCHTAICGFGQAAGSYNLIKQMQVDYIKIDGSIVMGVTRNAVDLTKLKAIAKVASATNRITVAEFVETDRTLAVLRCLGVDLAQGFGVARPVPLSQLP